MSHIVQFVCNLWNTRPQSGPPAAFRRFPGPPQLQHILLLLVVGLLPASTELRAAEQVVETRFAGVLTEAGSDADAILRRFEVVLLTSPQQKFFVVIDDARNGCPWPGTFGQLPQPGTTDVVQPHLLYVYDALPVSIHLPPLVIDLPVELTPGLEWQSGSWSLQAMEQSQVQGAAVWQISARERRGRRQSIVVNAKNGMLVDATMDVFMGQGDRFVLSLQQSGSRELPEAEATRVVRTQSLLLELQRLLERRVDSEQRDLTARQIMAAEQQLPGLVALSGESPLTELIQRIQTDLTRQQARLNAGAAQSEKMVGRAAPHFSLNLINGNTVDSADMRGSTTVLHFWDYRDKPLSEPYGQTGYLEFLHNQDQSHPVRIIGVSTNDEFQTADTVGRARRSARKLAEFMNLSYDIGYDDGALLRSLGDPRDSAGQLPLWVVISPEGQITHYHAGHYEVDAREGLRELREQLRKSVR